MNDKKNKKIEAINFAIYMISLVSCSVTTITLLNISGVFPSCRNDLINIFFSVLMSTLFGIIYMVYIEAHFKSWVKKRIGRRIHG